MTGSALRAGPVLRCGGRIRVCAKNEGEYFSAK